MKDSYTAAKKWFYGADEEHNWNDPHLVDDWPCTQRSTTGSPAEK